MSGHHFELLIEEPSMEAFLGQVLPRMLPEDSTAAIRTFNGKPDLLRKISSRFRGYRRWLPENYRIVVLVDRDNDDCRALKCALERAADDAGLITRKKAGGEAWQVANRIVIEELEAWYFGDWTAVRSAYPRVSDDTPRRANFRDPDAIVGGTAEAFERVLRRHGHYAAGLSKFDAAQRIGPHIDPMQNRSRSFASFRDVLRTG